MPGQTPTKVGGGRGGEGRGDKQFLSLSDRLIFHRHITFTEKTGRKMQKKIIIKASKCWLGSFLKISLVVFNYLAVNKLYF